MAELENITAANAVVVLTIAEIIPNGVQLQHFSTDQAFDQGETTFTETRMGVDGNLAAGWIPSTKQVKIMLEANSPSLPYLELLYKAMENNRTIYEVTLVAKIPSIRKVYTWTKGVLKSGTPVSNAKKVLDPTTWVFDFATFADTRY